MQKNDTASDICGNINASCSPCGGCGHLIRVVLMLTTLCVVGAHMCRTCSDAKREPEREPSRSLFWTSSYEVRSRGDSAACVGSAVGKFTADRLRGNKVRNKPGRLLTGTKRLSLAGCHSLQSCGGTRRLGAVHSHGSVPPPPGRNSSTEIGSVRRTRPGSPFSSSRVCSQLAC